MTPTVETWEDVSRAGGFDRLDGQGNRVYTTVKVVQVSRIPWSGGGPVRFASVVEFHIEDAAYSAF